MHKKLPLIAISLLFGLTVTCFATPKSVSALSGSEFTAGNIIDDAVFYDSAALNASDIQTFLNNKLPNCDTNGTIEKSYHYRSSDGRINNSADPVVTTTRATYGARYDKWYKTTVAAAPYTCLKSYKENTPTKNAESGICGYLPARTGRSAASIMSDVALACGVSPKVLIVLLQKEQGLVTDDWPWDDQYLKATGFACPDTSACNTAYYGFFNQVYSAARQYKRYQADPSNWNYVAGQNNKINFNPKTSCGYSWVYIQNQATAGLYNYTPYQPNAAALKNLGGTGDSCSAYGNRNFWVYFSNWFGTTRATPFFRIGTTDAIYVLGSNNNYYHVTSSFVLKQYGYGTRFKNINSFSSSYISGKTASGDLPLTARFEGSAIYLLDTGGAHHFSGQSQLNSFGYVVGDEATLPAWVYNGLVHAQDMQLVVKQNTQPEVYYIQAGKKSHITSPTAYTTLGTPIYSTQPSVTLSTDYVSRVPLGAPILVDNSLVKASDTGAWGIWDGSSLQNIASSTANDFGINPDYSTLAVAINQLPAASTPLAKLAKDSAGNLFILDRAKKLSISAGQLPQFGLNAGSFVTTYDPFLSRFATSPVSSLVRINNEPSIYSIVNGELLHVFSRDDFAGLDFNWADVQTVNSSTAKLFSDTNKAIFREGKLVRIGSGAEIYLINNSFTRKYVSSPSILAEYNFTLQSVVSVSAAAISGYSLNGSLTRIVKDGAGTTWLIDTKVKHKITTTMLSSGYYNINQATVPVLSDRIINSLSTGVDLTEQIQAAGDNKVYKIENGQKRWFTTPTSFANNGGDRSRIVRVSSGYVASIPTGADLN